MQRYFQSTDLFCKCLEKQEAVQAEVTQEFYLDLLHGWTRDQALVALQAH